MNADFVAYSVVDLTTTDDVIFRDSVASCAVACSCVSANYSADCIREAFCVFALGMRVAAAAAVFASLDPFD